MKTLNLRELHKLAAENGHPFAPVLLTAIIQTYLGGLERVLQFFMINIAMIWLLGTWGIFASVPAWLPAIFLWWAFSIMCGIGFASMYLEYLYCSKGSSFLTNVTGLSRLFCPDKNADHRRAELVKTQAEIRESQS